MRIDEQVVAGFVERFAHEPRWLVRAPGRVNVIGEHTDYNDGLVLPMAIDRAAWVAASPVSANRVSIRALDVDESAEFELETPAPVQPGWRGYVQGMLNELGEAGVQLQGWDGVLGGDIPPGAGLSSSAAMLLAIARTCVESARTPEKLPANE